MRLVRWFVLAVFAPWCFAQPALACELDPFLFQLPGETVAQANDRSEKILDDHFVVRHFNRETYDWDKAHDVFLARVVANTPGKLTPAERLLPSSRVQPIHALKGKLPNGEQVLTDEVQSGMCSDVGDGEGSFAKVGELVIVFRGLPESQDRPRGIDSFRAMSIRTTEILDRLRPLGKDLE